MALSDHPAWPEYRAALLRLAEAAAGVDGARTLGQQAVEEAGREFHDALRFCNELLDQIIGQSHRPWP